MTTHRFSDKITCAYLYPITQYGYPPDIRDTISHIVEMSALGFRSLELEGIGETNIRYLYQNHQPIVDKLGELDCKVPILCLVLPQLASVDNAKRAHSLELFEMGCEVAQQLGAHGVLDNGPLLPLQYPADAPIQRHYSEEHLLALDLPQDFSWNTYWDNLVNTYREACKIAERFGLAYHLHPCEGSLTTGTDSFLNLSNAVQCTNLLFNLDTANQFYFKDNLALSVQRTFSHLSYIHISDNRGHHVEHLVPGEGAIYWEGFFRALKGERYKGNFAIDVGGAETGIKDLRSAYIRSAEWLEQQLETYSLNQY